MSIFIQCRLKRKKYTILAFLLSKKEGFEVCSYSVSTGASQGIIKNSPNFCAKKNWDTQQSASAVICRSGGRTCIHRTLKQLGSCKQYRSWLFLLVKQPNCFGDSLFVLIDAYLICTCHPDPAAHMVVTKSPLIPWLSTVWIKDNSSSFKTKLPVS